MKYFSLKNKRLKQAVLLAASSFFAHHSLAQDTTSAVKGIVYDENGRPLSNSEIIIKNEDSGLTRMVESNSQGEFYIRNLPVGSNYSVTASQSGYQGQVTENVNLNLGQSTYLIFSLEDQASETPVDEIVITGKNGALSEMAIGPNATFGIEELNTSPAINRNISDVVRIDPRIYVDESRGDINAIQCGSKNPRFNSLTLDGVRTNDSFGLNSSGYPTERMPFSYDAIEQVSVELAPFDAKYGGFTACNINAVTKSGGNEFSGGFFIDYTDDGFRGDSLEGSDIVSGEYSEERMGIHVGGPILQDQLFFFLAFETLEGANLFDRGPIGSGAVNEVSVSQAEIDEILDIARTNYQYEPGGIPVSLDNEDEKLLVKLDWSVSDTSRLAFTYNYNDGNNFIESDSALNEIEFSNHLYERGAELTSYVLSWYSDWSQNFSTEVRIGQLELIGKQQSIGGTDFGEIRVELDDVDVYLGADDSRHSNELNYDVDSLVLRGNYYMDNGHSLSFGYEREGLEVYNLFVQHTETEIRFDGIDNFRDGYADAIYYNNAPSNNPADAAADWGYDINTLFIQDEFELDNGISLVTGLRYDWYTTDDKPVENPDFVAQYGFSNNNTVDGEGLLQPRLGFTWDYADNITLRGGVGLFTGGNPNVWLSNNYSANNVLQFGQRGRSFGYTDDSRSLFDPDVVYLGLESGVPNGPGWGIPSELYNAVAGGTGDNFEINYLDPDFELPSEWKFALGATVYLENDYVFSSDLLYTKANNTAIIKHGDLERVGTADDGYPIYDSVREASFVLTNSSVDNRSLGLSFSLSKAYDNGIDWRLGYAYHDAEDVSPMTSSVAFSNYQNRAFFDPEEEVLSRSNYNIEHRITGVFNWRMNLVGDNSTVLSLYGNYNTGIPYSYTFDGTVDPYNFTPYLDYNSNVLAPGDRRNDQDGSSWTKVDLKIEQEFPGFTPDSNASVFLVIDNLTNLLNDEWGILRKVNFPNLVERGDQEEARIGDASRYEIRVGINYDF